MREDRFQVVVLISADLEWQALKRLTPEPLLSRTPYGECFSGHLDQDLDLWLDTPGGKALWVGHSGGQLRIATADQALILFMHGGWGKVAAAGSTQYAIDRWKPDLVVNLGTCGGMEGEVETGQILLVDRTLVYDLDEQMGDQQAHIDHYTTHLDLSWLAEPYPQPVLKTLLVSGDADLRPQAIPELKRLYGAVAADWESASIAFVAARNGMPCLILRGVSDLVGTGGGQAYGDLDVFARNAAAIMRELVQALPQWLEKSMVALMAPQADS